MIFWNVFQKIGWSLILKLDYPGRKIICKPNFQILAIGYTKIQRINPRNPEAEKKWFISPQRLALKTV
jgi:hypothetical protein